MADRYTHGNTHTNRIMPFSVVLPRNSRCALSTTAYYNIGTSMSARSQVVRDGQGLIFAEVDVSAQTPSGSEGWSRATHVASRRFNTSVKMWHIRNDREYRRKREQLAGTSQS